MPGMRPLSNWCVARWYEPYPNNSVEKYIIVCNYKHRETRVEAIHDHNLDYYYVQVTMAETRRVVPDENHIVDKTTLLRHMYYEEKARKRFDIIKKHILGGSNGVS